MELVDLVFWGAIIIGVFYLLAQFFPTIPEGTSQEPLSLGDLGSKVSPKNPALGWFVLAITFFVFVWPLLRFAQRKVEVMMFGHQY